MRTAGQGSVDQWSCWHGRTTGARVVRPAAALVARPSRDPVWTGRRRASRRCSGRPRTHNRFGAATGRHWDKSKRDNSSRSSASGTSPDHAGIRLLPARRRRRRQTDTEVTLSLHTADGGWHRWRPRVPTRTPTWPQRCRSPPTPPRAGDDHRRRRDQVTLVIVSAGGGHQNVGSAREPAAVICAWWLSEVQSSMSRRDSPAGPGRARLRPSVAQPDTTRGPLIFGTISPVRA